MKKLLVATSLVFLLLSGATEVTAQDTQDDRVRQLQTRMDELKVQMMQLQAEIDAMHGVKDLSKAPQEPVPEPLDTGAIKRTMPPLQLTPEQQQGTPLQISGRYTFVKLHED